MRRSNFFFGQKVRDTELNSAFDVVDNALKAFLAGFDYVGIATGAVVTEHAPQNLTLMVSGPAIIYHPTQRHIAWSADQNLDCSIDENGDSTAVVTSGNKRYLSIFVEFQEDLSDPRIDKNGNSL